MNTLLFLLPPKLWMKISSTFFCVFILFHSDSISLGICVLTNACHHPRYLHVRLVRLNLKAIVFNLTCDDCLSELLDNSQLITEILVELAKITRHPDDSFA